VAALLDAAAAELAASGYDAATMGGIAERAGASIGSLYQFFPNKLSITQALCSQYAGEIGEIWAKIETRARDLPLKELVNHLVGSNLSFIDSHPALLHLLDAPKGKRKQAEMQSILIERLENLLLAQRPRMAKEKARLLAEVTLTILKAFHHLYLNTPPHERQRVVQEYKLVLFSYWSGRLGAGEGR
jgi:AcrR family transcriptional regulator